jgi:hypothetical protein
MAWRNERAAIVRAAQRRVDESERLRAEAEMCGITEQPIVGGDGLPIRIWIGPTGGVRRSRFPVVRGSRASDPDLGVVLVAATVAMLALGVRRIVYRGGWSVYATIDRQRRARWRLRCTSELAARRAAAIAAKLVRSRGVGGLDRSRIRDLAAQASACPPAGRFPSSAS